MTTAHSRILSGFLVLAFALVPTSAFAASSKTTCSVTVTTERGKATFTKKGEVLLEKGEKATIAWKSTNAKKATGDKNASLALSGEKTVTASKDATYTFKFANGSKKADCSVSTTIASAAINTDSLSVSTGKPTISGTATGAAKVRVLIEDLTGYRIYASKDLKVKKGKWSVKVAKSLDADVYRIRVLGEEEFGINELASERLTVLEKGQTTSGKGGTLAISSIPLLVGGVAKAGTSVPVAYVKVTNTGTSATSIEGITLKQTGSGSTDAVTGFSTSDDKGGSRTTVTASFKNGAAFVPLAATIEPGKFRIFTIKAAINSSLGSSLGKQLNLDVSAVDTDATAKGAFPIKGTTWSLSY